MASINSRKIELFNMLQKENNYRPTSYYAKVLGVSEKTIYNDISELNDELIDFGLKIIKIPRKGIMIDGEFSNIEKFIQMLKEKNELIIVNYSPSFRRIKLLELLFLKNRKDSIDDLAERFSVANTSILNDIKEIQNIFSYHHVHISQSNGFFKIEGKESEIQKSLIQYLMNTFENDFSYKIDINDESLKNLIGSIFDSSIVSLVDDAISNLIRKMKRSIEEYYKASLYISILVQISRINIGYHIEKQEEQIIFENLNYFEPYLLAVDIAEDFKKFIGLEFYESDIKSLSEKLFMHRIEPSLIGNILADRYLPVVEDIIDKMSKLLRIDITDDQHLRDSLLCHIPPMIYRLKNNYRVKNPLLNDIKKQYMVLFTLTWYATSIIEETYEINLNDDEVSFMLIHFQLAIEKKYIQKNIVVVCENGIATSELMLNRIIQILPYKDNIRTATKKELLDSDLSNIDFVISLVDLPEINIDVIKVNQLIQNDDIAKIMQHYSELTNKFSTLKNSASLNNVEFNKYFKEDLMYVNKDFKNKDECLEFISKQYEDMNLVTPSFRGNLITRESYGETSLYTGVAIPHANPDTVLDTKISVIKLNEKIKWGNSPVDVDIIIVLGISSKDINQVKNLIARILEIVDDSGSVEQLRKVKNSREMRLKLRELI